MNFFLLLFAALFLLPGTFLEAADSKEPLHYYNSPDKIHLDPNHVPGNWPLQDTNMARSFYALKRQELAESVKSAEAALYSLGYGEISFSIIKNEKSPVLGYFKNYFGVVATKLGVPRRLTMILDINSLDTAVPGRNNRILNFFFQSMDPELGTAKIQFDDFDWGGKNIQELSDGASHGIKALGFLELNGVKKDLTASLNIQKENGVWSVETVSSIPIQISDFQFKNRIDKLLESCNHKSISNQVDVKVKLYFK